MRPTCREDGMSELKALLCCPFCGHKAGIREGDGRFFVTCMSRDCYCSLGEGYDASATPDHHFADAEQATTAWNTRPALSPSVAWLDEFEHLAKGWELADPAISENIRSVISRVRDGARGPALSPSVDVEQIRSAVVELRETDKSFGIDLRAEAITSGYNWACDDVLNAIAAIAVAPATSIKEPGT